MKRLPTSMATCSLPTSSLQASSSPFTGVTSGVPTKALMCSSGPFFSPNYPPPTTASKPSAVKTSEGSDNQVLRKLLNSVVKIQELLEKTLLSTGDSEKLDSEFESFTTAALSTCQIPFFIPQQLCLSLPLDHHPQTCL